MKSIAQLIVSALAAGALLGSVASHATDISELPLKAGVLAKPNVIFAMDDSGSMDAEVMIDGNFQGYFYGNYGTLPIYPGNLPRNGSNTWDWNYFYLFPNGSGAGNRVYTDPSASYGIGIPPTTELAWTRSSSYNPLYYDSTKTYTPWSPAYVGTAVATYTDSPPAAARSHPALGTTTMALNTDLFSNATDWKFTYTVGMTIPVGSTNISCLWGTTPATTALPYTVPTSNGLCLAATSYYPATFWVKLTGSTCPSGQTCVTNYDGSLLQRYEIKPTTTSYPSGRSYAAEMQNFANWFTYYRKRRLMLAASMGQVLENITGLRMGVVAFNAQAAPTMGDSDSTVSSQNRLAITGRFYTAEGSGGTPTHSTMAYTYTQFDTNTNIVQYACQNNAMFVITDGFANDTATAPPSYSTATYGATAPYTAITANSLHDKALAYYTLRLRATTSPLVAGKVPVGAQGGSNPDNNTNLHVNTYGLTLGAKGSIYPSTVDPFVTAPTWPAPVGSSNTMIDDLWHATLNGRGQMYRATDAAGTASAVQAGLADILAQVSAQSGVAVSTVNLVRGDSRAYFGTYNPSGWVGDVVARSVNPGTGVVDSTQIWSANTLLTARDWTTRVIASSTGSSGVGFTTAAVGSLVNPGDIYGTTSKVMDYLRGDRSNEGTLFRKRTGLMGAVINSEPYISNDDGVLYVASGEGMLHAIDIKTSGDPGKELWAFVPRLALGDIGSTVSRSYAFKTQLDGSPVVGTIAGNKKLLVAGMGAAAGSFYAIDVTSPRGYDESTLASKVMWEFPAAGDSSTQAKVGQALGRPLIVKTNDDGYVVLVTSGYNSTADGKGRMWMLNASTGAVIKEFTVADGSLANETGLAHITAYDEGDGTARYVYGGDLLGNVWSFDLKDKTSPSKLAALTGPTGVAQSVTAAPEVAKVEGFRVVIVPTGRILGVGDFANNNVQSIYAIKDGSTLSPARSSLVAKTYTRGNPDTLTGSTVDWNTQRGWYMDLPAGEHANTRPSITYGGVAFVTNVNGGTDCSAASYLYLIDVKTGGKFADSDFIGAQISAVAGAAAVTTVVTSDGKARGLVQDYNGLPKPPKSWNPPPIPASKTSWREIRRQ
jgi:type IV pilus assembly protein PilY1